MLAASKGTRMGQGHLRGGMKGERTDAITLIPPWVGRVRMELPEIEVVHANCRSSFRSLSC